MTINKSKGQSLIMAGIGLREECFSHGQFYVACFRPKKEIPKKKKRASGYRSAVGTLGAVWITIIHYRRVKFESNDNYHCTYTKNDSERR
ncbi:ATP-dependent DNA helicase PIF1-like [Aphis craccivora]|uniref:ATP-dependent DNA helicase PIF1-like n=2 Tax=Aphis craccivora TaxID=307492 RepID=A0A6G0YM13_APHCR|nr:ATP-dependent DNA helicase PIF1-like [Aphis craccivora]